MKYLCPRGCGEVSRNPEDISSEDYFGACLTCDEDFYEFELEKELDKSN